jgi:3-dehydroquinate synthase
VCLCVDEAIAATHGTQALDGLAARFRVASCSVNATESMKTAPTVERLWEAMRTSGIDRSGIVVAMGGGIVGDVAGFAAASWLRGVELVLVPTTLLAMVDASIGGKTGINVPIDDGGLGKNLAGAFWPARLIVADIGVLDSLPDREFRCGLAESIKHAMIDSEEAFATLDAALPAILARDHDAIEALVVRSSGIKAAIVEGDPLERGDRALLNLGHTFAHAFEARHDLGLLHGEAVAIGLVAACAAAEGAGLAPAELGHSLRAMLSRAGLPTRLPRPVDHALLRAAMGVDKKRRGGQLRLVLPRAIGDIRIVDRPEEAFVEAGLLAVAG